MPIGGCHLSSVIGHRSSVNCHLSSVICHLPTANCQLSTREPHSTGIFFSTHFHYSIIKSHFMPQSNRGGSNRNNSTSKKTGDNQRSSHSEKGKSGQTSQGAQGQKGKEDMGKG